MNRLDIIRAVAKVLSTKGEAAKAVETTFDTIRAALNEIFDYGRPASVALAVLLARDGRELPIQADVAGQTVALSARQHIKLMRSGDPAAPFTLAVQETAG